MKLHNVKVTRWCAAFRKRVRELDHSDRIDINENTKVFDRSSKGASSREDFKAASAANIKTIESHQPRIHGFNDRKDLFTCQHGLAAGDNGGWRESLALKIILSAPGLMTAAIQDIGLPSRRIGTLSGNGLFFIRLQQAEATKENSIVG